MKRLFSLPSFKNLASWVTLVVIFCLPFIFRIYTVTGGSMEPGFGQGSVVVTENISHNFHIGRGTVIVMRNPHKKEQVEIKRVVGVPHESIDMDNERILITRKDGTQESFLAGTSIGGTLNEPFKIQLGPEDYFVLGDNRSRSTDSRSFGAVQAHDIIARVLLKVY